MPQLKHRMLLTINSNKHTGTFWTALDRVVEEVTKHEKLFVLIIRELLTTAARGGEEGEGRGLFVLMLRELLTTAARGGEQGQRRGLFVLTLQELLTTAARGGEEGQGRGLFVMMLRKLLTTAARGGEEGQGRGGEQGQQHSRCLRPRSPQRKRRTTAILRYRTSLPE